MAHFVEQAPLTADKKTEPTSEPAVILLGGGLDSTTVLAVARSEAYVPYALIFRYGQRHSVELEVARCVAVACGCGGDIDLRIFECSSLTADVNVPRHDADELEDEIPVTYVLARNTIFLSCLLARAVRRGSVAMCS